MNISIAKSDGAIASSGQKAMGMKLEVIVIPVSEVERSKRFYAQLGWRLDADVDGSDGFRVIQFTPPGSDASVIFGRHVTSAVPGSVEGLHLVVTDIQASRSALIARGIDVGEVFHDAGGVFHRSGIDGRVSGPDPRRSSYGSFATFDDPDGNRWVLQEVTVRLPGRVTSDTTFKSVPDLAAALKRAADAHGEHEKRTGEHDVNWPEWYAEYMVREQDGQPLPL